MNYLVFDTETTGLPKSYKASHTDTDNYPRIVQLAWVFVDGDERKEVSYIIKPDGYTIPDGMIHGISQEQAKKEGITIDDVLAEFIEDATKTDILVCHNYSFDSMIVACELYRLYQKQIIKREDDDRDDFEFLDINSICTMKTTTELVGIRNNYGFKFPKLSELHWELFGTDFENAHNALADVKATEKCFLELIKRKFYN